MSIVFENLNKTFFSLKLFDHNFIILTFTIQVNFLTNFGTFILLY